MSRCFWILTLINVLIWQLTTTSSTCHRVRIVLDVVSIRDSIRCIYLYALFAFHLRIFSVGFWIRLILDVFLSVLRLDSIRYKGFGPTRQLIKKSGKFMIVRAHFLPVSWSLLFLLLLLYLLLSLVISSCHCRLQISVTSISRNYFWVFDLIRLFITIMTICNLHSTRILRISSVGLGRPTSLNRVCRTQTCSLRLIWWVTTSSEKIILRRLSLSWNHLLTRNLPLG
jgi:hypothetical protein